MNTHYAVEINNLTKKFGKQIAVDHISLRIKTGEIIGILGPNGAGKTTIIRMMTELLKPTSGTIKIFGRDIEKESKVVRSLFGLTGQYASIDEDLSAKENLIIFSRLNGLSHHESIIRTNELLREFSLINSADKTVSNFSGGMRRRLDLAVSLISHPKLIFLDEPTTGLDPRTRIQMWSIIKKLVSTGSTIILTTQYLEEVDQLADRIAVIDHGKIVSLGTPDELKSQIGNTKLYITFSNEFQTKQAQIIIKSLLNESIKQTGNSISVDLRDINKVTPILENLSNNHIMLTNLSIEKPSMDDVFFALTVGKN